MLHNWLRYRRHIERNPRVMSGEPCIAGTRMPTEMVYDGIHTHRNYPDPIGTFVDWYDDLFTREQAIAALWYESLPHRRFQRWWDEHGFSIVWNRDREW